MDVQAQDQAKKQFSKLELQKLTLAIRDQAILSMQNRATIQVVSKSCSEAGCLPALLAELPADLGLQSTLSLAFGKINLTMELADTKSAIESRVFSASINTLGKKQLTDAAMGGVREMLDGIYGVDSSAHSDTSLDVGSLLTVKFNDGPANVWFDGVLICSHQKFCTKELSKGKHVVSASRENYRDTSLLLTIADSNRTQYLTLQANAGRLEVVATDALDGSMVSAQVRIGNQAVGRTPWVGLGSLSNEKLEIRAPGYMPMIIDANAPGGTMKTINVTLQRLPFSPDSGMVSIVAGCFSMGASNGDPDVKPVHDVCLRAFWIDRTEVTKGAYEALFGQERGDASTCGADCAMTNVNWNEASNYCRLFGKQLPTEAEWEYVARAGSKEKWPWGQADTGLAKSAWWDHNSASHEHAVGQMQPNAWGIYDMLGNVAEWTQDYYDESYYAQSISTDPLGPSKGTSRVVRGGSWNDLVANLVPTTRSLSHPQVRSPEVGFRCVSPRK